MVRAFLGGKFLGLAIGFGLVASVAWAQAPAEKKPAEAKPAETKPAEKKPAEAKPFVPPVLPRLFVGQGWKLMAPASGQFDREVRPPVQMRLIGEGSTGFPNRDGTLRPLSINIEVHRLPPETGRIEVAAEAWVRHLKGLDALTIRGEIEQKPIQLVGGTPALLIVAKAVHKGDETLISYHHSVIAATGTKHVVIVHGALNYGLASHVFVNDTGLAGMLVTCVQSLAIDDNKPDEAAVNTAFRAFDWNWEPALGRATSGLESFRSRDLPRAVSAFGEAVRLCPSLSVAQQKLAWISISSGDPQLFRPREALQHAELAVKQTGMRELEALDTLALCYLKTGKAKMATDLFRQALTKDPQNIALKERLSLYGQ